MPWFNTFATDTCSCWLTLRSNRWFWLIHVFQLIKAFKVVWPNPINVYQPYLSLIWHNGKCQNRNHNFCIWHMTRPRRVKLMGKTQMSIMLTICKFWEVDQLIFFSAVSVGWPKCLRCLGVSICEAVEKRVISGHNQMSPTDQGSSSLTRLPLHPHVIAAKLFNCPKLPSNDVNCRGHQ